MITFCRVLLVYFNVLARQGRTLLILLKLVERYDFEILDTGWQIWTFYRETRLPTRDLGQFLVRQKYENVNFLILVIFLIQKRMEKYISN